jgi:glutamine synthetase
MSNPRVQALRTATERPVRAFQRPSGPDGQPLPFQAYFGQNTFRLEDMQAHLPAKVVRRFRETIEHGHKLDVELANHIARAVLDWATARGVSHYCHWFQPLTGSTAEKHDSFIAFDDGRPIAKFSGAMLIQSEPDASSFPSGGMRSTFEARGYTAWDPTSPMFIMERTNGATLCIPSVFISYHGAALDNKTPLLRSMEAINTAGVRLAHALGDEDVTRITPTAGPEQEYFLVDKAWVALRPDLHICGRSLHGAPAPKGQTLEDHYFGSIPGRVLAFMQEVDTELYKLGVPAKTRHNEVAPCQFEIAILYGEANVAADHNQLVMEILRRVADRHGFVALLHEKPFAGVNGSGKHLNWSMSDNLGRNLLEPGDNPHQNLRFLAYLSATVLGVWRYGGLLRASIATHGNDFRLGANEAPPAIMSAFLGDQLSRVADALANGTVPEDDPNAAMIQLGVSRLPEVSRDNTDRNRTSPFAFTGNKFEFRAVGSNMSVSFPAAVLNTVVADGMRELAELVAHHGGGSQGALRAVEEALRMSAAIRFEGNNYSAEWVVEAERRGLPNLRTAPAALEVLKSAEIEALFERQGVLRRDELESRYHIHLERYITTVDIESDLLCEVVDLTVIPAALAERGALAADVAGLRAAGVEPSAADLEALRGFGALLDALREARKELDRVNLESAELHGAPRAAAYAAGRVPALARLRGVVDQVEARVADHRWPLPRYREMLFQNG